MELNGHRDCVEQYAQPYDVEKRWSLHKVRHSGPNTPFLGFSLGRLACPHEHHKCLPKPSLSPSNEMGQKLQSCPVDSFRFFYTGIGRGWKPKNDFSARWQSTQFSHYCQTPPNIAPHGAIDETYYSNTRRGF